MSDSDNKKQNSSLSISKGSDSKGSINPKYKQKGTSRSLSVDDFVEGVLDGNRTILSRAITLIESSKPESRDMGQEILERCLPHTGDSIRIGITGVPGVGKSTFIDTLGKHLLDEKERKLAVLTVDPSSSRSKGSILGDKTRMQTLAGHSDAYIRPSPTSGTLGGVARKTRETMLLCEAAGFNTLFVETVGVGQSEIAVHSMVDFFLLLMLPGAGDELQGIKRGIMEMADLIAINKAEKDNLKQAKRAKRDYENAVSLLPPSPSGWKPPVLTCSAVEGTGIPEIQSQIESYIKQTKENGFFTRRRSEQASYWMHETIHQQLKEHFYEHPEVKEQIGQLEKQVRNGTITSFKAATKLLNLFKKQ